MSDSFKDILNHGRISQSGQQIISRFFPGLPKGNGKRLIFRKFPEKPLQIDPLKRTNPYGLLGLQVIWEVIRKGYAKRGIEGGGEHLCQCSPERGGLARDRHDGFNIYHSLRAATEDLGGESTKWL